MVRVFLILMLFPFVVMGQGNRTSTALNAGEQWLGDCERVDNVPAIVVYAKTDQDGALYAQFSHNDDCENVDSNIPFTLEANQNEFHRITVTRPYFRMMILNNSASNQTYLRAGLLKGDFQNVTTFGNSTVSQDADTVLTRGTDFDLQVAQGKRRGIYLINRFGQNTDIDTNSLPEDLWGGSGVYAGFPGVTATAENVEVLSSSDQDDSVADGTGAHTMRIWYFDTDFKMFDANGDHLYTDVILDGQSVVDTGVSALFVWRAAVLTAGSGNTNAGVITIRWATTESVIFQTVAAGIGQTRNTAMCVPDGFKGYLKNYDASMFDTSVANEAEVNLRIYAESGAISAVRPFAVSNSNPYVANIYGGLEFPEKTCGIMRVSAVDNSNASIAGQYQLILVKQ